MGCRPSVRVQDDVSQEVHEMRYDMWVMRLSDFLEMEDLPPHQELLSRGLLNKHDPHCYTLFVSHQWLGWKHPDPLGQQMGVLRRALHNIIEGEIIVETNVVLQSQGNFRTFSPKDRQQLRNAYLWLDWFSAPQAVDGNAYHAEQVLCVQSIPAYVQNCNLFVALVPSFKHADTGHACNFSTWLSRGWCRTEMWCNQLSLDHRSPVLSILGNDRAEFTWAHTLATSPVQDGYFGVEADRVECCAAVRRALDAKLSHLTRNLKNTNLDDYRYLLARKSDFLGEPPSRRSLKEFLADFAFHSELALKQRSGMGAVACAVLSGDLEMLETVARLGAPLEARTKRSSLLVTGQPPLHLAALRGQQGAETLEALLELRADPNGSADMGGLPLSACHSASCVEILVRCRADVNLQMPPAKVTPLVGACAGGVPPEVMLKLIELRADVNQRGNGVGVTPLAELTMLFNNNPYGFEATRVLLQARADVNLPCKPVGVFRLCQLAAIGCTRIKQTSSVTTLFSELSTTPLGIACLFGHAELAEELLRARADPSYRSNRGHLPIQLARCRGVREVLMLTHEDLGSSTDGKQIFSETRASGTKDYEICSDTV